MRRSEIEKNRAASATQSIKSPYDYQYSEDYHRKGPDFHSWGDDSCLLEKPDHPPKDYYYSNGEANNGAATGNPEALLFTSSVVTLAFLPNWIERCPALGTYLCVIRILGPTLSAINHAPLSNLRF
jgi:hypothetical protein